MWQWIFDVPIKIPSNASVVSHCKALFTAINPFRHTISIQFNLCYTSKLLKQLRSGCYETAILFAKVLNIFSQEFILQTAQKTTWTFHGAHFVNCHPFIKILSCSLFKHCGPRGRFMAWIANKESVVFPSNEHLAET